MFVLLAFVLVYHRRFGAASGGNAFDARPAGAASAGGGSERALAAADRLRHVAAYAVDLHAGVVEQNLVRVLVNQIEVVVDVADVFAPELAPAAVGLDRARVQHPTDHVHVVNVLFDYVVARKPGEVVPVADLPIEFRLHLLAFFAPPEVALVPCRMGHRDRSERALVNKLLAGAIGFRVVTLKADDDRQVVGLAFFAGVHHDVAAGHVYGQRLFGEDVFFGGGGRFEMFGAEARRRDEQHGVDLRPDDFLVRFNPDVGALRIDFKTLARLVELVLEIVGQRDDLGLAGRFE